MAVSLIIPAYNEEQRLKPFLDSVVIFQGTSPGLIGQIVVVDDGSSDATASIAERYAQQLPLQVIRHQQNQGKGAAVQTGVLQATEKYVVFIDADGATPITELPKMVTELKNTPVVIGNRWMKGATTVRHSTLRRLSGYLNRKYMSLFGLGDVDTMCGFKGFERTTAQHLFRALSEKRWLFDTEIMFSARRQGYALKNIPIAWQSKDGSKLSTAALLKSAWQIYPLIRRLKKEVPQGVK
jgi:glycosyltransferase involved in cell wall biosynthesis